MAERHANEKKELSNTSEFAGKKITSQHLDKLAQKYHNFTCKRTERLRMQTQEDYKRRDDAKAWGEMWRELIQTDLMHITRQLLKKTWNEPIDRFDVLKAFKLLNTLVSSIDTNDFAERLRSAAIALEQLTMLKLENRNKERKVL